MKMTLNDALRQGLLPRDADQQIIDLWNLHVKTVDGKLGEVRNIECSDTPGLFTVTLQHFNGEPFARQYYATDLELLARRGDG